MKKVILIILDGWGIAPPSYGNAIASAQKPTMDFIESSYPSCLLQASGAAVGLSWGHEGNSEVGHINIGAGRIVPQYLPRIITSIRDGSFWENRALKKAAAHAKKNSSSFHIMGLVSSGSVHSYIDHLYGILEFAKREGLKKVFLHIFTDGKDSPPDEGAKFIPQLEERLKTQNLGQISTVMGRVYAMDRNENWEYTEKAYNLLTGGGGKQIKDIANYLKQSYSEGADDQTVEPAIIRAQNTEDKTQTIQNGDSVVFFNFREDSARQLTKAFVEDKFSYFKREKIQNLEFVVMTKYYQSLPNEKVAFPPLNILNTLPEVLAACGKTQLHISESEKYAHVTYFFNGLKEKAVKGEERILIPSMGSLQYDKLPAMQAAGIRDVVIKSIGKFDFIIANFANADMLGHTGNMQATMQGVEIIDSCVKKILEAKNDNTTIIITADHGNAEEMLNARTGSIRTEHSANPVPFYLIQKKIPSMNNTPLHMQEKRGVLADVAPTILEIMNIPAPLEMTGESLLPLLK